MKRTVSFSSLSFYISLFIQSAICTTHWMGYPGFDDANNWESGYLPCSLDEIMFPESYASAIMLSTTLETIGITLPREGALFLPPDSSIIFSSTLNNGRKCKNSNQQAKLLEQPSKQWFDPGNWHKILTDKSDKQSNSATPHIERIPCDSELVEIPAVGPLSIDMNDIRTLRVKQINLDGANVSTTFLEQTFSTELGEIMFKHATLTKVEYNDEPTCGCHRSDLFWEYEWNVCQHVEGICEKPNCFTPIIPSGHCCAICGAMLKVIVDKCDSSYLQKLKFMLEESLKKQELQDQIVFHMSFVDAGVAMYLQVVAIEKSAYEERSVLFIHHFNQTADWNSFKNKNVEVFTAGRPYNPNAFLSAFYFILGTFVVVCLFFTMTFLSFSSDRAPVRLPSRIQMWWSDLFGSPFVFARFENTPAQEGNPNENLVINIQQYHESVESPENEGQLNTCFDNPMFEEHQAPATKPSDDDDVVFQEEDMAEIDLNTTTEENI